MLILIPRQMREITLMKNLLFQFLAMQEEAKRVRLLWKRSGRRKRRRD